MTWIEEQTVAVWVCHVIWVVAKKLAVENIDKVCTTHSSTGMSRLCLLDHRGCKDSDIIRSTLKFVVFHSE
jgi:hypothetical protein